MRQRLDLRAASWLDHRFCCRQHSGSGIGFRAVSRDCRALDLTALALARPLECPAGQPRQGSKPSRRGPQAPAGKSRGSTPLSQGWHDEHEPHRALRPRPNLCSHVTPISASPTSRRALVSGTNRQYVGSYLRHSTLSLHLFVGHGSTKVQPKLQAELNAPLMRGLHRAPAELSRRSEPLHRRAATTFPRPPLLRAAFAAYLPRAFRPSSHPGTLPPALCALLPRHRAPLPCRIGNTSPSVPLARRDAKTARRRVNGGNGPPAAPGRRAPRRCTQPTAPTHRSCRWAAGAARPDVRFPPQRAPASRPLLVPECCVRARVPGRPAGRLGTWRQLARERPGCPLGLLTRT